MTKGRKSLAWFAISLVVLIGLIGLYTAFEYTLVPELRERFAGADTKEGVTLGGLLFDTRGCSGCHALGGVSNATTGPDLGTIAVRASASEIRTSILDPDAVISENCLNRPCVAGLMPAFGEILAEREIDALVAFLLQYDGVVGLRKTLR